jgi:hypothetical protein
MLHNIGYTVLIVSCLIGGPVVFVVYLHWLNLIPQEMVKPILVFTASLLMFVMTVFNLWRVFSELREQEMWSKEGHLTLAQKAGNRMIRNLVYMGVWGVLALIALCLSKICTVQL